MMAKDLNKNGRNISHIKFQLINIIDIMKEK